LQVIDRKIKKKRRRIVLILLIDQVSEVNNGDQWTGRLVGLVALAIDCE